MAGIYDQLFPEDHWKTIHQFHEEIFAHIRDGDAEKARAKTLEHLNYSLAMFFERNVGSLPPSSGHRPASG